MRGRIIPLPHFCILFPCAFTRCPAEDKEALSLIKNGHSYILRQHKYNCNLYSFYNPDCLVLFYLPVQKESVSGTAVSSQQISCLVYQLLSLATMVTHLCEPISSSSFTTKLTFPEHLLKPLPCYQYEKNSETGQLLLISYILLDNINFKVAVFSNNSVLLAVS